MGTVHFTTFLASVFIFGADLSPACEMRDLQDCLKHMTGLPDGSDLTAVCSATDETKECLKRLVGPGHSCTGRLHQTITRVLSDLDVGETASKCLELKDSSKAYSVLDCSTLDISTCISPMQTVSDPSDIDAVCRALSEVKSCMANYSEKCGGDIQTAVDVALQQFENVEPMCQISNTTDSVKADSALDCSTLDISTCISPMQTVSDPSDIDAVCRALSEVKSCMANYSEKCGGDIQTAVDVAFKQFENIEPMCQISNTTDSVKADSDLDCSLLDIYVTCISPMQAVSDPSDIDALCRALSEAKSCMAHYSEKCGGDIQAAEDEAFKQFEHIERKCQISNTTDSTDGDTEFDCSPLGISNCVSPVESLMDPSDISALCQALTETKSCLSEYSEKCGGDVKSAVDVALQHFKQDESLCGISNNMIDCSPLGVAKCASPMAMIDPSDKDALCRARPEVKSCLSEYSEKCDGDVKSAVDVTLQQFEEVDQLCGISNVTYSNVDELDFDCSPPRVSDCVSLLSAMSDPSNTSALCQALPEAKSCLSEYSEKCGEYAKDAQNAALKELEQVEPLCGNSNMTDSTDGDFDCSPLGISKCVGPMTAVSDPSDISALCQALPEVKSCLSEYSEKCGGEVKNAVDMALQQFEQVDPLCGISNTTDQDTSSSICSFENLSKCNAGIEDLTDFSDLNAMCRLFNEVKLCLDPLMDNCSSAVKESLDIALKLSNELEPMCDSLAEAAATGDDTSSGCSTADMSMCMDLSDLRNLNAENHCRHTSKIRSCLTKLLAKDCTRPMKSAIESAVTIIDKHSGMCNSTEEEGYKKARFLPGEQNVTVTEGDTARLTCAVRFLGTRQVIWSRMGESSPLSVGSFLYTPDSSFSLDTKTDLPDEVTEWNLLIANTNRNDEGVYQCRISSRESNIRRVRLNVVNKRPMGLKKARFLPGEDNVTVTEGDTARLTCAVRFLGTQKVVWSTGESNILTVGNFLWVENRRFSLDTKTDLPDEVTEWNLLIADTNRNDEGVYQCEIYSKESNIRRVRLNVVNKRPMETSPGIELTGKSFVERGQAINLICKISKSSEYVDWFKDGEKIYSSGNMRVVNILDEWSEDKIELTSRLHIEPSSISDSGTYVCRSNSFLVASQKVTVLLVDSTNIKRGNNKSDGDDEFTFCSNESRRKCWNGSPFDGSNVTAWCRSVAKSKPCLEKLSVSCDGSGKMELDSLLTQYRSVCETPAVNETTAVNETPAVNETTAIVVENECTIESVSQCLEAMDYIEESSDSQDFCRVLSNTTTCLKKMNTGGCEPSASQLIGRVSTLAIRSKALCEDKENGEDSDDGPTACTPENLSKCVEPHINADFSDSAGACSVSSQVKSCIGKIYDGCSGSMKASVDQIYSQFRTFEQFCSN